ncbi:DUF4276 family protein [Caldimonas brevitalea]|nr:DUF4276 family protein [Caldimonas brevitalea]
MTTIVSIVEGDGEVRAVPLLLRRIAEGQGIFDLTVPQPIRVHRDQFIRRPDELKRKLLLAAAKAGDSGAILVLLDADDECPVELAADISRQSARVLPHRTVSVVIAVREYEAWFLAGAKSLAGKRGLDTCIESPADPDSPRNAKGWLNDRMKGSRYHEVVDQPALTALLDIDDAATRSRSLRKLVAAVKGML